MEASSRGLAISVTVIVLCGVWMANADESSSKEIIVKKVKGVKVCDQGWECRGFSKYCCNLTISDYFQTYQFENLFSKRNSPVAKAVGFWDYRSFILAAAGFEPLGFGTTGGKLMQMKELAAFLGHVGCKTSCEFKFSIYIRFMVIHCSGSWFGLPAYLFCIWDVIGYCFVI